MIDNDYKAFELYWKGINNSFHNKLDGEQILFDFMILKEFQLSEVGSAIKEYIGNTNNKFAPTVTDIIGIINKYHSIGSSNLKTNAINAWQLVEEFIGRCGYITSPDFQDDIIHNAINNIGGWISICQSTNAEQTRNNFLREYKEVAQSGVWQHYDYVGNSNQIALKDPIDGTIKLFNSVQDKNNFLQFTKENQKLIAEKNKSYLDKLNELEEPTQETETQETQETQETHATINNKFVCRDVNKKIITDKKGNELFDFEKYNTVYCVGGSVSRDEKGEHFEGCKFFNVNLDGRHFEVRNKYQGRYQERAEQQASMYQSTVNNMR